MAQTAGEEPGDNPKSPRLHQGRNDGCRWPGPDVVVSSGLLRPGAGHTHSPEVQHSSVGQLEYFSCKRTIQTRDI